VLFVRTDRYFRTSALQKVEYLCRASLSVFYRPLFIRIPASVGHWLRFFRVYALSEVTSEETVPRNVTKYVVKHKALKGMQY
jgi:hypothetical protein